MKKNTHFAQLLFVGLFFLFCGQTVYGAASQSSLCENVDPFIQAAKSGDIDVVSQMLNTNINLNVRDCKGSTALHEAVRMGQLPVVELLIAQEYIDVDGVDNYFQTPLYFAALRGDLATSMRLVEAGARLNKRVVEAAAIRLDTLQQPLRAQVLTVDPITNKPELREVEVSWPEADDHLWPSEKAKQATYVLRAKALVEYFEMLKDVDFKAPVESQILQQVREDVEVYLMLERSGQQSDSCGF